IRIGMCIVGGAAVALAMMMARGATMNEIRIATAVCGVGMGLANTALIIAVQASVGFSTRGVATAATMFFRNIAGTLGIGVMGVVLTRALVANAPEAALDGRSAIVAKLLGPERRSIDPAVLRAVASDLARGLVDVGWVIVVVAIVGALVAWFFPRVD